MGWVAISFALIFLVFPSFASCSGTFYQKVSDDGEKADVVTEGFHYCSLSNNCNYLGIPTNDNDNKVYSATTKKELQGTKNNLQIWEKMAPEHSAEKKSIAKGDTGWRVGDGIGGSEKRIGKVSSKEHCYALCSKTKKKGKYANGATVDVKTNTDCYCEFGMKDRDDDQKWISSYIERKFKSCKEAMKTGVTKSGEVQLTLANNTKIDVYCDMLTDGGGWIVFQRRTDNQTTFERNWQDYENGFGSPNGSFWVGLKAMHNLTASGNWTLRVDLQASDGDKGYAQYTEFSIGGEQAKYAFEYENYAGNVGDSLKMSKGFPFSTFDQENDSWDKNCALVFQGAWWHNSCFQCNLNNMYPGTANKIVHPPNANMMSWYTWKADQRFGNIIFSEMKIREGTSG